jgi:hypothetical protein
MPAIVLPGLESSIVSLDTGELCLNVLMCARMQVAASIGELWRRVRTGVLCRKTSFLIGSVRVSKMW